jgi:opacity protein-like surface antigen
MWKRSIAAFFLAMITAGAVSSRAQVVPSATKGQFTLTAGGFGSVTQPDYAGFGVAQTSPNRLYGIGAFVDVRFRRWVQVEAEGRWSRFNEFENISEDNYLIGPRIPIHSFRFMRATPYGKVLVGFARMNFENNDAWGRFTDIAYGGGVDFRLTNRISARGDFEYQQWPDWLSSALYPYSVSAGVSYRILGGGPGFPKLTKKELSE